MKYPAINDPIRRLGALPLALSLASLSSCSAQTAPRQDVLAAAQPVASPAFPGALGHGAASKGGRGGRIIHVTSLADSGPGTYRACVEASGPRICIFRVSGLIRFTNRPPIIRNPFLTIAGHTAPGGGIILAHAGGMNGITPLVIKNTNDVVVRHIRVRLDRTGFNKVSNDAFTIENSRNVILDHVSGSWAADELINGHGDNDNVTISWSIFAEGIPKHDKCALLSSDPTGPQRLSFIGNLCAHNGDRNPDINVPPGSCVEVVNNVLYNAQSQFAEIWESEGGSPVSLVGNVMRSGKNTTQIAVGIDRETIGSTGNARIYLADNRFEGNFQYLAGNLDPVLVASPPCPLTVRPVTSGDAYNRVLAAAGAFPRDPVDERIVSEVKARTGQIRMEPGKIEVGGAAGSPYPDHDSDGMDDQWEVSNGADPRRADSWQDADGDGLANLDEFLHHLHVQKMESATN